MSTSIYKQHIGLSLRLVLVCVLALLPLGSIAPNPQIRGISQRAPFDDSKPSHLLSRAGPASITSRQMSSDQAKKLAKTQKSSGYNSTTNQNPTNFNNNNQPITNTNNNPNSNPNNPFNNNSPFNTQGQINNNNDNNNVPFGSNSQTSTTNNPFPGSNNGNNNQFTNGNNPANGNNPNAAVGVQCNLHQSMLPNNNTVKMTSQTGIQAEDCYDALGQLLEAKGNGMLVRMNGTEKRKSCGTCRLKFEMTNSNSHASLEIVMFGTNKQRNGGLNVLLSQCAQQGGQIIVPAGTGLKTALRIDVAKAQSAQVCSPKGNSQNNGQNNGQNNNNGQNTNNGQNNNNNGQNNNNNLQNNGQNTNNFQTNGQNNNNNQNNGQNNSPNNGQNNSAYRKASRS
ncbi:hypothetical protein MJO28_015907 [Puccinia striiformis f. sp. tritici]|uniref:Uncharacterized protein n=1 Tax=Puccinia striiformis f. sp. tritici TaxID=168172 RepID=A0ACC0DQ76_9BASI|nr:hypothetical protein Pst134EB_029761 [Puccinia striiformis f. sp. tritici]KAI7936183.1 hypothetical protein MJO29_015486 [Puccinia striiformis f. sp. tritici]KAI7937008.1 hypothetical protein MJO28_015907 [Puccinia striiformis f. sp. tritici]